MTEASAHGADFWQLGIMVPDIEAAMTDLSSALGLTWTEVRRYGTPQEPLLVTMSRQGPPYFELVQGPEGSAWDSSGGPRLDHLAYWTDDIDAERARLEGSGFPVVHDGQARGKLVNYHAVPTAGLRIEVFAASRRQEIRDGWDFEDVG